MYLLLSIYSVNNDEASILLSLWLKINRFPSVLLKMVLCMHPSWIHVQTICWTSKILFWGPCISGWCRPCPQFSQILLEQIPWMSPIWWKISKSYSSRREQLLPPGVEKSLQGSRGLLQYERSFVFCTLKKSFTHVLP